MLAYSLGACDPQLPAAAPEAGLEARPRVRVPDPVLPAEEGQSADLLQQYAKRDRIDADEPSTWELPFKSKRLAVALLITAAKDRPEDLALLLTEDATWGWPDTRQFGRRRVFDGDGGERFMAAFRKAARRFAGNATWQNQPLVPGVQEMVRSGAEPMWSFWEHRPERIYLRMIIRDGHAKIDYIGFFEDLPQAPILVRPEYGVAPGLAPPLRRPEGAPAPAPTGPTPSRPMPREER
jgi:hypothetical protein